MLDYPCLPQLDDSAEIDVSNLMLMQELSYDRGALSIESLNLVAKLNNEQRKIFDHIMGVVNANQGGFHFVHGYGGDWENVLVECFGSLLES